MARERTDHTWQPTALVNELYLTLRESKSLPVSCGSDEAQRLALFGLAGFWMKRMLIHHARHSSRHVHKTSLDADELELQTPVFQPSAESLSDIDRLLDRLGEVDAKLRTVVELRVFEGMTGDEIADRMGCSRRTVTQYWTFARKWLREAMARQ